METQIVEKVYDIDYFIDKFTKIPKDLWTVGSWDDGYAKCASGLCGATVDGKVTEESEALNMLFIKGFGSTTVTINDNISTFIGKELPQDHPKDRIMAVLNKIKFGQLW